MEGDIENTVDTALGNIFGGIGLYINILFGILMLTVGICIFLLSPKRQFLGWIFIGVGCLGIFSGIIQLLL